MGKSRKPIHHAPRGRLLTWVPPGLVLLLTVLAPLVAGRFDYQPQAALYLAIALAALAGAVGGTSRGDQCPRPVLLLWVLAGWTALSWLSSVYRHATELEFARLVVLAAWAGLVAQTCRDTKGRELWLTALCLGAAIAAWIGIAQYIATPDRQWRTFSTFYNPNELATCLVMGALCAAGLAFGTDQRPLRVLALTAGISCVATLLLTGSRGGGVAFVIGALFFAARMGREMWRLLTPATRAACLVLTVVVLGAGAKPLASRLAHAREIGHSQSFRVSTWRGTARMAAARPVLGFGGGTYEHAYPRFAEVGFTRAAHNVYLQFAAEQGLPGMLLFLGALVAALVHRDGRKGDESLVMGMKAALVASAVHGLLDYGWQIPALALLMTGLMGGIAATPHDDRRRTTARARAQGLSLVALAAVALGLILPESVADRRASRAAEAGAQGSLNVAAERYVQAMKWSPRNEEIRLDYASVLEGIAARSDFGTQEALREAERQYQAAVRLAPTHASALRKVGRFYARQNRHQEAVRWFEKSVEAFPNYTSAHYALGESQRALKQPRQAEQSYQRVLAIADGPAGQLQAVPELAFDDAVARAALRLATLLSRRGQHALGLAAARRGLREMESYRKSERYQMTIARVLGVAARLSPAEADLLEAQLQVYRAVGEWHDGRRGVAREAAEAAVALESGVTPLLKSLLPPEALTEVDGLWP